MLACSGSIKGMEELITQKWCILLYSRRLESG